VTIGNLKPDLTFVLDVPTDIGLARAAKRRGEGAIDRFEGENIEFHERLRDAFLQVGVSEPDRCVLIDARAPRSEVAQTIWNVVNQRLSPTTASAEYEHVAS
jgi:dTMP kinase